MFFVRFLESKSSGFFFLLFRILFWPSNSEVTTCTSKISVVGILLQKIIQLNVQKCCWLKKFQRPK